MLTSKKQTGFTAIEILVVVVIIGILAAIILFAFGGYQQRAIHEKGRNDLAKLASAIRQARINKDGVLLKDITGSYWSSQGCSPKSYGGNPGGVEPRFLPKSHACWTQYYNAIDTIAAASGTNLSGLKAGDALGNPYIVNENEGEVTSDPCDRDYVTMVKPGTANSYSPVVDTFNTGDTYGLLIFIPLIRLTPGC